MRAELMALLLGAGAGPAPEAFIESENSRRPLVPWSSLAASGKNAVRSGSTAYDWAAFTEVPGAAARSRLTALGVEVLGFAGRPGPYHLYKVRIQARGQGDGDGDGDSDGRMGQVFDSLKTLPSFVNLLPILPQEKMSRKVSQGEFREKTPGGKVKATVYFHRFENRAQAEALLAGKVDSILTDNDPRLVHVIGSPERVLALAELEEVARVEDFMERLPLKSPGTRPRGPGKD